MILLCNKSLGLPRCGANGNHRWVTSCKWQLDRQNSLNGICPRKMSKHTKNPAVKTATVHNVKILETGWEDSTTRNLTKKLSAVLEKWEPNTCEKDTRFYQHISKNTAKVLFLLSALGNLLHSIWNSAKTVKINVCKTKVFLIKPC